MKKTNKTAKKFVSLVATGALLASMATPVMAADITMEGNGQGFAAYQLLTLTTATSGETTNYSYSVNSTYRAILAKELQVTFDSTKIYSAEELYDIDQAIINAMYDKKDATEIRTFADNIYAAVKDMTADETSSGKAFSNVDQGYYLIVETTAADNDAKSLVMLDTAGQENITVKTKEGVPSLTKKVADTDSADFVESVSARIGEEVTFQLTGTMPNNIDQFTSYKYIFHDTLPAGLDFVENSVSVTVGETTIAASNYTVKTGAEATDPCSLEVAFNDIKAAVPSINENSKVVVTYKAKVNTSVNYTKAGNANTALLEFSNDPYNDGPGENIPTSKTPADQANVFSFQLTVDKVDKDNQALAGAGFTLQKKDGTNWVEVEKIDKADNKTKFVFNGLDAGTYKLIESTVPNGYTKARDMTFVIGATYAGTNEKEAQTLNTLTVFDENGAEIKADNKNVFTISVDNGTMQTNIVNRTGLLMPTTGGMGTVAIYGTGAVLLFGGLRLILKRQKTQQS